MHLLEEHQSGIEKEDILTKEGIDDQNYYNDSYNPQDILEDVDNDDDDNDKEYFLSNIGLEH